MKDYLKVISNMAVCHITIYKHIKKIYSEKPSIVSFSHSYMLGKGINISGKIVARTYSHFTNKIVLNAFAKGNFSIFLKKDKTIKKGNYIDFWGLNYYAISYFKGMQSVNPKGFPLTDMGWLVYPEGIIQSSNAMLKVVELPIFITENGTCDSSDKFRIRYIYEHLKILSSSKLSIQRYYHWCLVDNFEWNSGLEKQFGLIKVDNITKVRTIKESGRFYSLLNKLELDDKEILELVDKSQYTKYS
jgi:beta-glucosidase